MDIRIKRIIVYNIKKLILEFIRLKAVFIVFAI
ncbi:hypothetical protein M2254_000255 [Chryseobacterium sp. BIGb0186]|nr:hypothetical protein [Chryseobacterium sp. JUb44]MDH6208671.1 hypothetical protein [Chryseobacterium sp. BIGb0186]